MKQKIVIILAFFIFSCSVFGQTLVDANAQVVPVPSFHGIHVSGGFDVYITQSNEEAVAVSVDDKYKKNIEVGVKDGILYVGFVTKGVSVSWGSKKLKAYISFKKIDQLTIRGACDVNLNGKINLNELSVKLSGASDLHCKGNLEVNKMAINISGASDANLNGKVGVLYIDASGASNVKAFDMAIEVCDIECSGASDVHVQVNKELSADASGASDIKYKGDAKLKEVKSSGASSVKRV